MGGIRFWAWIRFLVFRSRGTKISIEHATTGELRLFKGEPIEVLRGLLKKYHSQHIEGFPRFTGGAVGYVSYDAVRLIERIPETVEDDLGLDDIYFSFYDSVLAFDNVTHKVHVMTNVHTEGDLEANYEDAVKRIDALIEALAQPVDASLKPGNEFVRGDFKYEQRSVYGCGGALRGIHRGR